MTEEFDNSPVREYGLGRGLEALFATTAASADTAATSVEESLLDIPVLHIRPNPQQPRSEFSSEKIQELAESIKSSGLLQPLAVQPDPDRPDEYLLIAGERRWRACQLAGLLTVPAIVRQVSPRESLSLALIENLQRADLSPLEQARAFLRLSTHHDQSHAQIAQAMGISRSAVTNSIRLLGLPEPVQAALEEGQISVGHARAILSWPTPEAQVQALRRVLTGDMTVRQTEESFLQGLEKPGAESDERESRETRPEAVKSLAAEISLLERRLRSQLRTKVRIHRRTNGSGRLVLSFFDDESLNRLLEHLLQDQEEDL